MQRLLLALAILSMAAVHTTSARAQEVTYTYCEIAAGLMTNPERGVEIALELSNLAATSEGGRRAMRTAPAVVASVIDLMRTQRQRGVAPTARGLSEMLVFQTRLVVNGGEDLSGVSDATVLSIFRAEVRYCGP